MSRRGQTLALALLPLVVVLSVRLPASNDLDFNDQAKQALYVLDILENGNWILPLARGSELATKPPLLAWAVAGLARLAGGAHPLLCQVPSALAFCLAGWLLFLLASEGWGERVAVLATWALASSALWIKLSVHVRPDMLLSLAVVASFFALHRAERGAPRGTAALFWLGVAFSALAKGPVGPLLALSGAGVLLIPRSSRARLAPVVRSRWAWALALPVAWVVLAFLVAGPDFFRDVVLGELVDRTLSSGSREGQGQPPGFLFVHFLSAAAPWSLFALGGVVALARNLRRRQGGADLFFPAAWLVPGLVLLNLTPAQRSDYLLPLIPGAVLLAAAYLGEPGRGRTRVWRGVLWGYLASAAAVGLASVPGVDVGWQSLESLTEGVSAGAGLGLLAAGLCLLGALAPRSPEAPPRFDPALLGAAGILALHLTYAAALSPEARAGRGVLLERFVGAVREERLPEDELVVYGNARNGLRFLLGLNRPSLTREEVSLWLDRAELGRRLLVIANDKDAAELEGSWPGRFRPLVRQLWDRPAGRELVLLQAVAPGS